MSKFSWREIGRSTNSNSPSPINVLSFSNSGTLLASGDDDCIVTVWSLENERLRIRQILTDELWGQITALQLDQTESINTKRHTIMFVGTGEGTVSVCVLEQNGQFSAEKVTVCPFDTHQPVSHLKYNSVARRLVVGGMAGAVAFYEFEAEGSILALRLNHLFNRNVMDIPFDIHFVGSRAESVLVHCIRDGRMCCLDVATGKQVWSKKVTYEGSLGHAALSRSRKLHLVQNLSTGQYDLYPLTSNLVEVPLRSFEVPRSPHCLDAWTQPCAFVEDDHVAVMTSDVGVVLLVAVETGELIQELIHTNGSAAIQALAVWQSKDGFETYLAVGSTDPSFISVWKKVTPKSNTKDIQGRVFRKKALTKSSPACSSLQSVLLVLVIALLVFIAWREYTTWSPRLSWIIYRSALIWQLACRRTMEAIQSVLGQMEVL